MAIIDNTIAGQMPQYNAMTPLAEVAKVQNMQAEAEANQFKIRQAEVGAEARGLAPFVNTPEFPARWAEAADRMAAKGWIDPQTHQQWRNKPSPLMLKQMIAQTEDPTLTFRKQEAQREQGNTNRLLSLKEKELAKPDKEPENVRAVRAAGIAPASPEGRKALFPRTDTPISATDKKMIGAAEDELPNIEGTIDALKIAKDLNAKTFTGVTASARGFLGTAVPGGGMLVDKDAAMATSEFGKVMSGEAIKTMADTLKGATTDFELNQFKTMLADPTTPPEIRGRIIDRMLTLSEKQRNIKVRRINDLRGGTYFKPEGGQPATSAPVPSQGSGADVMLQHAKEALAQGADRGAVLLRLQKAGISPDGL